MNKNFTDRFIEENGSGSFWNLNKKVGAFLAVLFLGVVMMSTTGCTQNGQSAETTEEISVEVPAETSQPVEEPKADVMVGNDGVNAGMAGEMAEVGTEEITIQDDDMVAISLEDTGRADPFLPLSDSIVNVSRSTTNLGFEVLPPLETLGSSGSAVEKIITTKVSGIMYDNYSPSAILNIDGTDYLVRSGDEISDYKILSISKSVVTVQSGPNIYKAGVGQLLTEDNFNQGNIANLENKFGSANNRSY